MLIKSFRTLHIRRPRIEPELCWAIFLYVGIVEIILGPVEALADLRIHLQIWSRLDSINIK